MARVITSEIRDLYPVQPRQPSAMAHQARTTDVDKFGKVLGAIGGVSDIVGSPLVGSLVSLADEKYQQYKKDSARAEAEKAVLAKAQAEYDARVKPVAAEATPSLEMPDTNEGVGHEDFGRAVVEGKSFATQGTKDLLANLAKARLQVQAEERALPPGSPQRAEKQASLQYLDNWAKRVREGVSEIDAAMRDETVQVGMVPPERGGRRDVATSLTTPTPAASAAAHNKRPTYVPPGAQERDEEQVRSAMLAQADEISSKAQLIKGAGPALAEAARAERIADAIIKDVLVKSPDLKPGTLSDSDRAAYDRAVQVKERLNVMRENLKRNTAGEAAQVRQLRTLGMGGELPEAPAAKLEDLTPDELGAELDRANQAGDRAKAEQLGKEVLRRTGDFAPTSKTGATSATTLALAQQTGERGEEARAEMESAIANMKNALQHAGMSGDVAQKKAQELVAQAYAKQDADNQKFMQATERFMPKAPEAYVDESGKAQLKQQDYQPARLEDVAKLARLADTKEKQARVYEILQTVTLPAKSVYDRFDPNRYTRVAQEVEKLFPQAKKSMLEESASLAEKFARTQGVYANISKGQQGVAVQAAGKQLQASKSAQDIADEQAKLSLSIDKLEESKRAAIARDAAIRSAGGLKVINQNAGEADKIELQTLADQEKETKRALDDAREEEAKRQKIVGDKPINPDELITKERNALGAKEVVKLRNEYQNWKNKVDAMPPTPAIAELEQAYQAAKKARQDRALEIINRKRGKGGVKSDAPTTGSAPTPPATTPPAATAPATTPPAATPSAKNMWSK